MNVLTQRIGPLPAWAWGTIAAAGVWFFFLRGKPLPGASSSTASGAGITDQGYSLGYAQGVQAAGPQSTLPASTGSAGAKLIAGSQNPGLQQYGQNIPLYQLGSFSQGGVTYGAQPVGQVPFGTNLTSSGAPVSVPWGSSTATLIPVNYLGASGYYVSASDISYAAGASVGGPARKHHVGARSKAGMWHDAHPLVGAAVRYAHFVRAVGGPANHHREVHRVATQAGVHPARVAMLNPVPTGMIRVA